MIFFEIFTSLSRLAHVKIVHGNFQIPVVGNWNPTLFGPRINIQIILIHSRFELESFCWRLELWLWTQPANHDQFVLYKKYTGKIYAVFVLKFVFLNSCATSIKWPRIKTSPQREKAKVAISVQTSTIYIYIYIWVTQAQAWPKDTFLFYQDLKKRTSSNTQ